MINQNVFMPNMRSPEQADSLALTAGVASLKVDVNPGSILRLVNTHATQTLYVNFGSTAVVATVTDLAILARETEYVQVPISANVMAYLGSGASTLIHFTRGN